MQAKDAQMSMYEVKKAREQKALEAQERLLEMQEMQMLMLEPNLVTDPVRAEIIRLGGLLSLNRFLVL